ncbi:MAG: hypothetical protein M9909_09580 [Thermomicrobiales bacterium]|nr:hypothetical protein [Thermomicrobiales bacterium]
MIEAGVDLGLGAGGTVDASDFLLEVNTGANTAQYLITGTKYATKGEILAQQLVNTLIGCVFLFRKLGTTTSKFCPLPVTATNTPARLAGDSGRS